MLDKLAFGKFTQLGKITPPPNPSPEIKRWRTKLQ